MSHTIETFNEHTNNVPHRAHVLLSLRVPVHPPLVGPYPIVILVVYPVHPPLQWRIESCSVPGRTHTHTSPWAPQHGRSSWNNLVLQCWIHHTLLVVSCRLHRYCPGYGVFGALQMQWVGEEVALGMRWHHWGVWRALHAILPPDEMIITCRCI